MNRTAMRLGGRHQVYLYSVGLLLVLSGALWLLFHYFVRMPGEFGETQHPLESWWLRVHGLAAAAFLIGFGSVLPGHVRRAWTARRNRISGTLFFALLALMIASGYVLYYTGDETARALLSVLHWVIGIGMPALMGWHVWRGRVARNARAASVGHRPMVVSTADAEPVVRLVGRP